jgi:hypothetical protein
MSWNRADEIPSQNSRLTKSTMVLTDDLQTMQLLRISQKSGLRDLELLLIHCVHLTPELVARHDVPRIGATSAFLEVDLDCSHPTISIAADFPIPHWWLIK